MEIGRNLPKQPFSTDSGRVTLKNCQRDYFPLLKSPDLDLGCRFLDVLVLIRWCSLYIMLLLTEFEVDTRKYLFWHSRRMDRYGSNSVRSMDLKCQNKYFPYGPKSRLIRAFLYAYRNKMYTMKFYWVKADSHVSGHRIRPKRKWTICYWQLFFMTVFIRRAPVEDNIALEGVRIVPQRMVVKFYNHTNTMRTCTDTLRFANDTWRIPVYAA